MTLIGHSIRHMTGSRPFGATAKAERVGQSFKVKTTGYYSALAVPLQTIGSPTDGVRAYIESDYGGLPAYCFRGQPLVEDQFVDDDGTTLYAHDNRWFAANTTPVIQSNRAQTQVAGYATYNYVSMETGTLNMVVEADVVIPALPANPAANDWSFGIIARHVKGEQTYYELRILYQSNSPEIELFGWAGGLSYKTDGTRNGTDDILQHNTMLDDVYVPGDVVRLRLVLNGTSVSGYVFKATQPMNDGSITPTTYVGSSAPNGWVGVTVSDTLHALIQGTRAGLVQDPTPDQPGVWDNFAVYASDIPNVSNTVPSAAITADLNFVTFVFQAPVFLLKDTTYHWYLDRTGDNSTTNFYAVGVDTGVVSSTTGVGAGSTYADGNAEVWNSTSSANGSQNSNRIAAPFWTALSGESCIFLLADVPMSLAQPRAATVTKAVARQALARLARDWAQVTTTSAGSSGGSAGQTAIFSSLIGYGDDYFNGERWLLQTTDGGSSNAYLWRRVDDFTSSTGTFTFVPFFAAQVANTMTFELHAIRPDLYTTALNQAARAAYPAVRRIVTGLVSSRSGQEWYRTPGEMRDIARVHLLDGSGRAVAVSDFEQSADKKTFRVGAVGSGTVGDDCTFLLEGAAPLSLFTEDTALYTSGTVVTDTTATLEINVTDDAWQVYLQYALAYLYELASQPGAGGDPDDRARYAQQAGVELQKADALRAKHRIPSPRRTVGYPQ